MFFTVIFGDHHREIFNADCRNKILLHNIKQRCNCTKGDTVELSDEDGTVKNMHINLLDYATEYVKDRENLILLRVIRDHNDDVTSYIPLLYGKEDDKAFISKLNPKPTKQRNRRNSDEDGSKSSRSSSRRGSVITGARRASITTGRRASNRLPNSTGQKK